MCQPLAFAGPVSGSVNAASTAALPRPLAVLFGGVGEEVIDHAVQQRGELVQLLRGPVRQGSLHADLPGSTVSDREVPRLLAARPPALLRQPGEGRRAERRDSRAARPVHVGSLVSKQRHPRAPAQ